MADVNSIMAVLTTNVGLSFLLDLDNDLYAALYAQVRCGGSRSNGAPRSALD